MGRNGVGDGKKQRGGRKRVEKGAPSEGIRRSARTRCKNFKITDGRLTVPTGFFSSGFKSATARKKTAADSVEILRKRNRDVLDENLHALLQPAEDLGEVGGGDLSGWPDVADGGAQGSQAAHPSKYQTVSDYYLDLQRRRGFKEAAPSGDAGDVTCALSFENSRAVCNPCTLRRDQPTNKINTSTNYFSLRPLEFVRPKDSFTSDLFKQIKLGNLRSAADDCLARLKGEIAQIDGVTLGKTEYMTKMSSSQKRSVPQDDDYDNVCQVPLIPQSQWVYSTPDKQNMKKMFVKEAVSNLVPAVYHTSKKNKVLYDITNECAQYVGVAKLRGVENVPIDKRYLKRICEDTAGEGEPALSEKRHVPAQQKENVFQFGASGRPLGDFVFRQPQACAPEELNVFMSKPTEDTIDIHRAIQRGVDFTLDVASPTRFEPYERRARPVASDKCHKFDFRQCRSALTGKGANVAEEETLVPDNYHHQLQMVTQRPSKSVKKLQKRNVSLVKSLSFENTPPGSSATCYKPKRLQTDQDMEDDFRREFEVFGDDTYQNVFQFPNVNLPCTATSTPTFGRGGGGALPGPGASRSATISGQNAVFCFKLDGPH